MSVLKSLFVLTASVSCVISTGCANNKKTETIKPDPAGARMGDLQQDAQVHAYVDEMRDDLSKGKVKTINATMNLSVEEAKLFWPIYQQYETELFALSDRRVDVIAAFAEANADGKITNPDGAKLAGEYFAFQTARLDLIKKYHAQISTELSPVRAAQFVQIEHRVNTVIDVLIASEFPLLRAKPSK